MTRSMFSKRHYAVIASVMADMRKDHPLMNMTIAEIEDRLCKIFEDDNPAFNQPRFYAACHNVRTKSAA
jgi:hypothetical protein